MSEVTNFWYGVVPTSWNIERLQWHLNEIKENNKPIKTDYILSLTNINVNINRPLLLI